MESTGYKIVIQLGSTQAGFDYDDCQKYVSIDPPLAWLDPKLSFRPHFRFIWNVLRLACWPLWCRSDWKDRPDERELNQVGIAEEFKKNRKN